MKLVRSAFYILAMALVAGCGSGGGTQPTTGGGIPPTGSGPTGPTHVLFSITIPNQTSPASVHTRGRIRPQYISSNTESMSISVNGGTAQTFALTPATNPNCITLAGATTCSNLSAVAAPGLDSFTFAMYSNSLPLPPTPTVLSIVTVNNKSIVEGVANQLGDFTMNPVLGTIAMSVTYPGGGFVAGASASGLALNVSTKDPSGATIIAPGNYVNASGTSTPIGLSTNWTTLPNDAVWAFRVDSGVPAATGSLASPSDSATLSFSGSEIPATTITAAAGTINASQVISAISAPIVATLSSPASGADYLITTAPPEIDFYESAITGTVALSEAGYAGTFTLQSSTCNSADVTFSPGVGSSASSFVVGAQGAGTSGSPAICTATFSDANAQTLSVTFSVTTIGFGLQ